MAPVESRRGLAQRAGIAATLVLAAALVSYHVNSGEFQRASADSSLRGGLEQAPGSPASPVSAGCHGSVPVHVSSSTEKSAIITGLAEKFNQDDAARRLPDGACARIGVDSLTSGRAEQYLKVGWPTTATDPKTARPQPEPQVWLPSSSLWPALVGSGYGTSKGSIAQSPLVLAMPAVEVAALEWKEHPRTWLGLLRLFASGANWRDYQNHPEWGRFRLAQDRPQQSTSGLESLVVMAHAAANNPGDPRFVQKVQSSVTEFTDNESDLMRTLNGLSRSADPAAVERYTSGILMPEQLLFSYDRRTPDEPLVPLYPTGGTVMFDHPYIELPGLSAEVKAAADLFHRYLMTPKSQHRLELAGFRINNRGAVTARLRAIVPAAKALPPRKQLPVPSTSKLKAILAVTTSGRGRR